MLLAIELLLDGGEFKAADELYLARLDDGQVFKCIPALPEGLVSPLDSCGIGTAGRSARKRCRGGDSHTS